MKVVETAAARREFADALAFYAATDPNLVEMLFYEMEASKALIAAHPKAWPRKRRDVRGCPLRKFPFAIYYQVRSRDVLIVAYAHGKRRPGYWLHRVKDGD